MSNVPFNGFVFDTECDNLFPLVSKFWILRLKDVQTGEKFVFYPFEDDGVKEKLLSLIFKYDNPLLCGHNILGYDMFVLWKFLKIPFTVGKDSFNDKKVTYLDTLCLSNFLNPDRVGGHSLENFGSILGYPKIKFNEFSFFSEAMDVYCERDVDLQLETLKYLISEYGTMYPRMTDMLPDRYRLRQKNFFLMQCQGMTGWKFDVDAGTKLSDKISEMMQEIEKQILPQLPPRKLKKSEEKSYCQPKKPFKGDGSLSASFEKWVEKHKASGHDVVVDEKKKTFSFDGTAYKIVSEGAINIRLPMELGNQDDLKEWLLSQGWEPTFWNYKRGEDGKPLRIKGKLIPTTPKIQEQGSICPNLLKMDGDLIRPIVKWLSLRNRKAVLDGWLSNPRLQIDGRLSPSSTGLAATHRQKHREVVNVPKAEEKVLLGKEFRSLFIAEDGMDIAAGDAAALEARCEAHWIFDFRGGRDAAHRLLDGDVHSHNALAFYPALKTMFRVDSPDFDKEHPKFKPYRSKSKNGKYALSYGCGVDKLASTLGIPNDQAQIAFDAFWEANPALKELKDKLINSWEGRWKQKYLITIDGTVLRTRKKSALINTLFQSTGAIIMEYACALMDMWLGGIKMDEDCKPYYLYRGKIVRRIGFFHDELEFECDPSISEEVARMIEKSIVVAGVKLGMKVPLAGEGKVGKNWSEVH